MSGTATETRYRGPYVCQCVPLRTDVFHATYCARFVNAAKVTPKLILWEKDFAPAEAVTPRSPANRSGQHQLPTKAGRENSSVATDATNPFVSEGASSDSSGIPRYTPG